MYLLYLDESDSNRTNHFVVGGIAVHEQDVFFLSRAVDRFCASLPPQVRGVELHADHIRGGKDRWRSVPKETREKVTEQITELLLSFRRQNARSPILFSVALDKANFGTGDLYERAYEDFFARCNGYLGRLATQGDRHRCVAIADKSRLEGRLQMLMTGWRATGASTGASIGPMQGYAEVPLFVDSAASRITQLADFVSHWVYRAYAWNDSVVCDRLLPLFDAENDVLHGLVHLRPRRWECDCPACASRRPTRPSTSN